MMTMSGSSGQSVQRRSRPEDEAHHITVSSVCSVCVYVGLERTTLEGMTSIHAYGAEGLFTPQASCVALTR
jgi:hypothetical protein